MGQIRNVVLIVIITAIMAVLTSIFAYFFDHLSATVLRSAVSFLTGFNINSVFKYEL